MLLHTKYTHGCTHLMCLVKRNCTAVLMAIWLAVHAGRKDTMQLHKIVLLRSGDYSKEAADRKRTCHRWSIVS